MNAYTKLILVTQRKTTLPEYLSFIRRCADAGITSVQLREKDADPVFLKEFGCALRETLAPWRIPLIVNDSLSLAAEVDADGLHLGQTDGDISLARNILGAEKIIGVSIESWEDLELANAAFVNYVSASAVFPSKNKPDIKQVWGLDGLEQMAKKSKHPVIAIGGITLENAKIVLDAGAQGLAVIGAIHDADHPAAAIKTLRCMLDEQEKQYAA